MYLLYFLLWIIFNGNITLEICLFGLVIAGVIFAFTCKFMDYSLEKEKNNYLKVFKFLRFIIVLIVEITRANLSVIRMILNEREEVEPALVTFDTDLETPSARAFLANCITLTPGTITVMLEDKEVTVHCLDESLSEGIDQLVFQDMLKDMEEK